MLQTVKVDDKINTAQNWSENESHTDTFRKKWNTFLELQEKGRWNCEDQDDEKSAMVNYINILHAALKLWSF